MKKINLLLAVMLLLCACTNPTATGAVSDSGPRREEPAFHQGGQEGGEVSAEADTGESLQAGEWDPNVEKYRAIIDSYWEITQVDADGDVSDAVNDLMDKLIDAVCNLDGPSLRDERTYRLWCSCADILSRWIPGDLGYAIADLNSDGVPELIILSEEEYFVHAIYSYCGEGPVLIGGYWLRNRCVIDEEGRIYTHASSGASDSYAASYLLAPNGNALELIELVGIESGTDGQTGEALAAPQYYWIKDGNKTIVSGEAAKLEWKRFPDVSQDSPTKNSGLKFVRLSGGETIPGQGVDGSDK